MAEFGPMTDAQKGEWAAWVASRPPHVRAVAENVWPNRLYRLKSSGHRVTIFCIDEHKDGSVSLKVDVTGEFNVVAFERRVFGVKLEELEECDLPADDELVGSANMDPHEAKRLAEELVKRRS